MRAFLSRLRANTKLFLALQALALAGGNYVGWSTIFREVETFCELQGGGWRRLTEFRGTATTNPLLSACFWGSIIFVIAFAWTVAILLERNTQKAHTHIRKIWWLLLAGSIFALANNIPLFYNYYTRPQATPSCSVGAVTNPFATSCFLGFAAFLAAFTFATLAKYSKHKTP